MCAASHSSEVSKNGGQKPDCRWAILAASVPGRGEPNTAIEKISHGSSTALKASAPAHGIFLRVNKLGLTQLTV